MGEKARCRPVCRWRRSLADSRCLQRECDQRLPYTLAAVGIPRPDRINAMSDVFATDEGPRPAPRMGSVNGAAVLLAMLILAAMSARRAALFGDAVTVWKDAIASRPTNARAWANYGLALLDVPAPPGPDRGDSNRLVNAEARRCLERSIALDRSGVFGHVDLAILLQAEDPERAIALCREVIRRRPRDARALHQLGRLLVGVDPREAEERFAAAVRLDPGNADCLVNLANMKLLRGDGAGAIAIYDRALEIAPRHPLAAANRQRALEQGAGGR